ncbi:conserved hypothetical protein [Gloeothece citriformis PCC 7424]|uniref:DUF4231 domain-containing protein n=1 Tax=Gloeothece citriformis (strain PCC 7424) TaxID=65393 RepID=B7KEV1_GLOC7|nr:DUF4231 domain-containing protein [Gloeothece citriformis]ACK69126.1 conserved hypothetical protein [Gloeothece citriformis PCC 7424]
MTNVEPLSPIQVVSPDDNSLDSTDSNALLSFLKIIEYLLLAVVVGSVTLSIIYPEWQDAKYYTAASIGLLIFVFLINSQVAQSYNKKAEELDLTKKAKLYTAIKNDVNQGVGQFITTARVRALKYSQDLINDYKKTRETCRNIYYIFQIATIVLSGVTPILVLVDKLETNGAWLKWLPVICPAVAAIVASIVTSFPFQENWVAANATVELLEAEQEKFILGVSNLYQYESSDESLLAINAQKTIENFITQVNNIHLKQLQAFNEKKQEDQQKTDSEASTESNQA